MSILVTGGRGKTSSRLSALLHEAKIPFVVASRSTDSSSPYKQVNFDWSDETTWQTALESAQITAVYLVPMPSGNMVQQVNGFIDLARARGAKRFVLVSSSGQERGSGLHGEIHDYLVKLGVDYAILRPTWFHENFSRNSLRLNQEESLAIYSAAGDGRIPHTSCDDIAAVAFRALVDEQPHNTDHVILGPELLSYTDIAAILSDVTGRHYEHVNITETELIDRFLQVGLPKEVAGWLASMDTAIGKGAEENLNDVVERVTGRPPKKFRAYVEENRESFM